VLFTINFHTFYVMKAEGVNSGISVQSNQQYSQFQASSIPPGADLDK